MVIKDAARTLVPGRGDPHGPLPPLLIVLTFVTGLVDAVSFLKLGPNVFVANMTGNIVFLGFALAGATNISLLTSVVAVLAFLLGALGGGRLANRFVEHRGRMLAAASVIEAALVAISLGMVGFGADRSTGGTAHYVLIALLALAMGVQNATVARRMGVADLTTSVLTLTLTGLAADSRLGGGEGPRPGRRLLAVGSMFAGALVGGLLVLKVSVGIAIALALVVGLLLLTALIVLYLSRGAAPWVRRPS
ncbi:MAG: DUF1275 domain-containing protein [Rubrobacter sp.]|nr:DUF1275 domain-containing protein [Rubrobacter sp.]